MDILQKDLASIRKKMGWSQGKLAEKSFLAQNTISQYETGARKLSTDMFLFLLGVMKVSFFYSFQNEHGETVELKTQTTENTERPIDPREIRNPEGFRLWALQYNPENVRVDINNEHFIVYRKDQEELLFFLYLDAMNIDELISVCEEEKIEYEEL